jgi:hypothetical protein
MPLDVSALTNYVAENENMLLTKSVFTARTSELILNEGTVLVGVKYAEKINILDTDAIFQNGAGCVRTSSGNTNITQRLVTVGEIAVVEDLCVKDLNKTYMSKKLARGTTNVLPFEEEYTNLKSKAIAKNLEKAIWQGDVLSADANMKRFDGYIKIIDAAGAAINANSAAFIATGAPIAVATGITPANVKGIVNAMWLALPADITGEENIRVFCGWDTFNKFINSFTDQNLFNFAPSGSEVSAANGVVIIPGTSYKLTAVHGLDGTNRLFALKTGNMVAAVDMENEEERWEIMADQFNDYLRFKVEFKYGVNVAFPNEIVSFKLV